ncbi:MAG TPA: hypothetical protein VFI13_01715 [Gemmatimonadales bacterium]|nr:hypothetical protein [Gemmatimonadales bacterium]
MRKLFGFLGTTVASYGGWYLASLIPGAGFMTEFIVSTIAGGFGLYYAVKYAREHFE